MNLTQQVQQVLNQYPEAQADLFDGGVAWEATPLYTKLVNVLAGELTLDDLNNNDTAGVVAEKVWEMFN